MIAHLTGTVAATTLDTVVLDVHGVGMSVVCTPGTIGGLRVGQVATVLTSLVVREESLTLYGFADADERDLWLLLQTVTGIGPKVALAFVAVLAPEAARRALAEGDLATLTKVPGIGKKGAERLVVELKDKVGAPVAGAPAPAAAWQTQVRDALVGLGWSAKESDKAVAAVADEVADAAAVDVAAVLRRALQTMVRTR